MGYTFQAAGAATGSVGTASIVDSAVTTAKIAAGAVTTDRIADGAVTAAKMASGIVGSSQIADDAVGSQHIAAGAVGSSELASSSVTSAKIADNAVTSGKIAASAVGSSHIADGAVATDELATGAVTTDKLAASAVTNAKLATDAVDTAQIKDASVTAAKFAPGAVGTASVTDNSITTAKIADAAVTRAKIEAAERIPTGALMDYAGTTAPTGWLLCDGAAVSRTTYAALFAQLGTTFGAGDGSTTFNVPDLRGRVGVGLDNLGGTDAGRLSVANTLGGSGGAQTHLLTSDESGLPAHSHQVKVDTGTGAATLGSGAGWIKANNAALGRVNSGTNDVNVGPCAINNTAADAVAAHNNMQPYLLVGKIIKT